VNRPRLKRDDRGVWTSPLRDMTLRRVETRGPRGGRRQHWTVDGADGQWPTLTAAANAHRDSIEGSVYLIHFARPFKHARHYLGWTHRPVDERLATHRSGHGANLLKHVNLAGIDYDVVRVWPGDRHLERQLKRWNGLAQHCPVCQAEERERRNATTRARRALTPALEAIAA
jgi:predicted GIY-YIG superfamily endonuclease